MFSTANSAGANGKPRRINVSPGSAELQLGPKKPRATRVLRGRQRACTRFVQGQREQARGLHSTQINFSDNLLTLLDGANSWALHLPGLHSRDFAILSGDEKTK
jgi:hypothetical protein